MRNLVIWSSRPSFGHRFPNLVVNETFGHPKRHCSCQIWVILGCFKTWFASFGYTSREISPSLAQPERSLIIRYGLTINSSGDRTSFTADSRNPQLNSAQNHWQIASCLPLTCGISMLIHCKPEFIGLYFLKLMFTARLAVDTRIPKKLSIESKLNEPGVQTRQFTPVSVVAVRPVYSESIYI